MGLLRFEERKHREEADHPAGLENVEDKCEKAGIEKDISPHTLRHIFATDLYRETGKIRLVQKALGHADLSTTMIYTHIVDEELEGAMKSFRGQ